MNRALELQILRTALARVRAREQDMVGDVAESPVSRYLDPEQCARERATVLRQLPVVVGFASQLARPGDYITHEASGVPVMVVRGKDGALRGFVNACRHRGTRILDGPCGQGARALVCPYHAWTYGLDGALLSVPQPAGFAGMSYAERGLVRLQVDIRFGLVFAVPTPGVSVPIDDFLGPFADDLESWRFADHVAYETTDRARAMNWKLMFDGSFEAYHVRHAHRRTIAPMFTNNTGLVADWCEPHVRLVMVKRSLIELGDTAEDTWSLRPHANVLYGLFPNTIILVQPDHAMVVTVWPETVNRSRFLAGMLIPALPATDQARRYWDKNAEVFWTAIEEDLVLGERIQETLDSGANDTLLFGRYEHLAPRWHAALERRVADMAAGSLADHGP